MTGMDAKLRKLTLFDVIGLTIIDKKLMLKKSNGKSENPKNLLLISDLITELQEVFGFMLQIFETI